MPMNTTFDSRPGSAGDVAASHGAAASTTWSTISAVLMLRCSPPWPVAQNGQAMPQPAWLETQMVARSG